MDDELFLADSSPSKPEDSSVSNTTPCSIVNMFYSGSKKSKVMAFYMMSFLVKRIWYKFKSYLKQKKLKYFLKWKYCPSSPGPFSNSEKKLTAMIYNLFSMIQISKKKHFNRWFIGSKIKTIVSSHKSNKIKREESHQSQITQINKAIAQLFSKQTETEKAISQMISKEKGYKEAIEELSKAPPVESVDVARHELLLKSLETENQQLRDKLEALECNVSGFIKEMSELLENEENHSLPSDDDGLGDSQRRSKRKKKPGFLR